MNPDTGEARPAITRRVTIPWRPVLVLGAIAIGTTTAISIVTVTFGWTVSSPAWAFLAPIAMWAPALGRFIARRTVDRGFTATLPLRRWGATGARVVLVPLAYPFLVYGSAYALAWSMGLAHWSPGGGTWTTGTQIAMNLVVNLSLLGVIGTFTAMGEELGWRGYLQPRLDAAGMQWSLVVVTLVQLAYHAPLMAGAGYIAVGGLSRSLLLFAMGDLPLTFLMARESYLARSLWPAIFFHGFHNTISQWLFPKFFLVAEGQALIRGEGGVLPMIGYIVLGLAHYIAMRRHGSSWRVFAQRHRFPPPAPMSPELQRH
jgi:membrane protease YdiL (CAAX protease family)